MFCLKNSQKSRDSQILNSRWALCKLTTCNELDFKGDNYGLPRSVYSLSHATDATATNTDATLLMLATDREHFLISIQTSLSDPWLCFELLAASSHFLSASQTNTRESDGGQEFFIHLLICLLYFTLFIYLCFSFLFRRDNPSSPLSQIPIGCSRWKTLHPR